MRYNEEENNEDSYCLFCCRPLYISGRQFCGKGCENRKRQLSWKSAHIGTVGDSLFWAFKSIITQSKKRNTLFKGYGNKYIFIYYSVRLKYPLTLLRFAIKMISEFLIETPQCIYM